MGDGVDNITSKEIKKLAETICELANDIKDVNFDSRGKGSFCELVSTYFQILYFITYCNATYIIMDYRITKDAICHEIEKV